MPLQSASRFQQQRTAPLLAQRSMRLRAKSAPCRSAPSCKSRGSLSPAGEETGADSGKEKQAEAGKKTPESRQTFEVEEGKDVRNREAVLSETLINVKTQFSWAKTDLFTERRRFLSALCSSGYSSPWHLVTCLAHWCAHTHTPLDTPCRVQPAGGSCGFVPVLITLLTILNNFLGAFRNPLHSSV